MKKSISRRTFVTSAAAGAAAIGAFGAIQPPARAQLVYTTANWKVSDFDAVAKNPARIKQVFEVTQINEGGFLNNIKNSLNGLHFGFGIPADQIKIVAALHGPPNMLNYDDFLWSKYKLGEFLKIDDPATSQPAVKNPYYPSKTGLKYATEDPDSRDSLYQDMSLQALLHRGVQLLSCHTATEEQVRGLMKHNNRSGDPEPIVREFLAHTIPGVLVVPAMVAAVALLQIEGHYAYNKV